jgi:hypothetical protein
MTIGKGGKYDAQCEMILLTTNAQGVALIVVDGNAGSGFSVSTRGAPPGRAMAMALESAARQIERDLDEIERRSKS